MNEVEIIKNSLVEIKDQLDGKWQVSSEKVSRPILAAFKRKEDGFSFKIGFTFNEGSLVFVLVRLDVPPVARDHHLIDLWAQALQEGMGKDLDAKLLALPTPKFNARKVICDPERFGKSLNKRFVKPFSMFIPYLTKICDDLAKEKKSQRDILKLLNRAGYCKDEEPFFLPSGCMHEDGSAKGYIRSVAGNVAILDGLRIRVEDLPEIAKINKGRRL